jgi:hypothetical protein
VAKACDPNCLGGRDQEDWGSKPAQASSSWDPNTQKKGTGGMAQGVGPDFKSQYCKKKEKKRNICVPVQCFVLSVLLNFRLGMCTTFITDLPAMKCKTWQDSSIVIK